MDVRKYVTHTFFISDRPVNAWSYSFYQAVYLRRNASSVVQFYATVRRLGVDE